jgi:twitching motility protein PilT
MAFDIDAALRYVVERDGSDLHVKTASPPIVRIDGELRPVEGVGPLEAEDTEAALEHILRDANQRLMEEFQEQGEVDLAYALHGV